MLPLSGIQLELFLGIVGIVGIVGISIYLSPASPAFLVTKDLGCQVCMLTGKTAESCRRTETPQDAI